MLVYLHRPADEAGQVFFLTEWQQGVTEEVIVAQIAGSLEYYNRL